MTSRPRQLLRLPALRALPVVAAAEAGGKRKLTKASDFRSLDTSQIEEEVQKAKRALFNLGMAQKTKQVGFVAWNSVASSAVALPRWPASFL